jgi:alginate O-acetyltransferase complex protein AlgJ
MTLKNISNFGFVIVFFLIILVIFGNNLTHLVADGVSTEKRTLATCPQLTKSNDEKIREYSNRIFNGVKDFEKCFDDNLSFRNYIISLTNFAKVKYFGISPVGNIEKGLQDWFYYNEPGIVRTFSGERQYTEQEKSNLKQILQKRIEFLNSKNIQYVQIVVPNKLTMYPEFLPKTITKQNDDTALAQYSKIAESISGLKFVNLAKELQKTKLYSQIFYKTDSHWNHTGMILGYNKVVDFLVGKIKMLNSNSFNQTVKEHVGDLSFFMNTINYIKDDNQLFYEVKNPQAINQNKSLSHQIIEDTGEKVEYEKWINPNINLPKAVLIGDSYTDAMRPFLAENFGELYYYKNTNGFAYNEIEEIKPDVVIQIFNESQLINVPKN